MKQKIWSLGMLSLMALLLGLMPMACGDEDNGDDTPGSDGDADGDSDGDGDADPVAGWGWATGSDVEDTLTEAIEMAEEELGENVPDMVLLFQAGEFVPDELLEKLHELRPDWDTVFGFESADAVATPDGYHNAVDTTSAVSIMAIYGAGKMTFGVAGAEYADYEDAAETMGEELIEAAIDDAGMAGETPALILFGSTPGSEEAVLVGVEDAVGNEVPLIGGTAGYLGEASGRLNNFANDEVIKNGVVMAAIFTDLQIVTEYTHGFTKTEDRGTVTEADGRTIMTIDDEPAAQVVNEWSGGFYDEEVASTEPANVLAPSVTHSIAKTVESSDGEEYWVTMHMGTINPDDSISGGIAFPEGTKIAHMTSTADMLLDRSGDIAEAAMSAGSLSQDDVLFGFYVFCGGVQGVVPELDREEIIDNLNDGLEDAPHLTVFTFGEQGIIPGVGLTHGNLMHSIAVFTTLE